MDANTFQSFKDRFNSADTQAKIDMYVAAGGLSHHQYRELLHLFPLPALEQLEAALA